MRISNKPELNKLQNKVWLNTVKVKKRIIENLKHFLFTKCYSAFKVGVYL